MFYYDAFYYFRTQYWTRRIRVVAKTKRRRCKNNRPIHRDALVEYCISISVHVTDSYSRCKMSLSKRSLSIAHSDLQPDVYLLLSVGILISVNHQFSDQSSIQTKKVSVDYSRSSVVEMYCIGGMTREDVEGLVVMTVLIAWGRRYFRAHNRDFQVVWSTVFSSSYEPLTLLLRFGKYD